MHVENFEVTPHDELTPNGFINLNLMEARDPQGGPDELWVTLETMGYSKKLLLTMVYFLHIVMFSGGCYYCYLEVKQLYLPLFLLMIAKLFF